MTEDEINDLKQFKQAECVMNLTHMVETKQIESFKIGEVTTQWETFSLFQKFVWFIAKYTFVAHFARKWYKSKITKLYNTRYKTTVEAVNAVNTFEDDYRRYWLWATPKENVTVDISIKPIKPAEYIKVDMKVEPPANKDSQL